jgi:small GTP-binding protein
MAASDSCELKLVLVGNTSVGKTCIVKMATTGVFGDDSVPTLGASYVSKLVTVGSTEVRLQIWDTAGQERYRGMTPMYFRGAHVAIIAYAITDQESFDGVDSWVSSLRNNADPDITMILVGNKSDMEDSRVVPTDKGEEKAKSISGLFFEVSAKTGDRIDELFTAIATSFLEKKQDSDEPKAAETVQLSPGKDDKKKKGCC